MEMKEWMMVMYNENKKIIVSIICNVYNQERYIRQALDGVIKQKTRFAFEILVHDDASTDNTPNIIREYEKRYPEIIKPLYQSENQYSKGISITNVYQLPRAKGRYIAFCEGDDYWSDENKLELQVDALEENPDINICAHTVSIEKGNVMAGVVRPYSKNTIIRPQQVILNGGSFVGTCSIMYKKSMDDDMPCFRKKYSMDYTIQIHGALKGGLLYIDKNMGVYRIGSQGSWTEIVLRNPQKAVQHYNQMIKIMNEIDKETNFSFHNIIVFVIGEYKFKKFYDLGNNKALRLEAKKLRFSKNIGVYKMYNKKTALKIGVKYQFPFLYKYLHKK